MGIFSMIGSLGSAAIGAYSSYKNQEAANKAQAKENEKQREWQKAENNEARAYNKMLAEQQNQWNIEQWNRENAYNTPTAQMARFGAAGLNPNLIYGQSNTAPQLSGSLTSGAPAQPTQGQFDSGIGDRMAASGRDIANQLMQIPMYAAQVANIRAQTKKIEADTKGQNMDNSFTEFIRSYNPDGGILSPEWNKYVNSIAGKKTLNELDSTWYKVQKESTEYSYLSEEANIRRINALIQGDLYNQIRSFAKDMDISQDDAETFVRSMFYSARGIKADALFKEGEAVWNDPSFLEKLPAGLPKIMMFLRSLLK